ncbi:MAG TPA: hypothetical protein PKO15_14285 [Fibrobacteria bacterium]|nr:hypothetical protein [Fibrobacteria bacterium]
MPDELAPQALTYFSQILGRELEDVSDLAALSSRDLLRLADLLPEPILPALVSLLKGAGAGVFDKLLGDHEEENRELSDRFFTRYRELVLETPLDGDFNPLEAWLPPEACQDLAFLSSRQTFFLRQEMDHINEWMARNFGLGPFPPATQLEAWNELWSFLTRR